MLDMYEMKNEIVGHLRSVFYLLQKANSIVINVLAVEDLSEYVVIPSTLRHESFMFEKLRELRMREGGICESGCNDPTFPD
ncbi:F-box/LRR-repeat protein [Cucumis melo var. makuwa]|uniref:F-box/LRR-repeat protein n=1 Tax=Cucumis melo var. makuwa TaxID=1194695 RepID=A0A5A7TM40_CUCMM|nr:F-box/LRR-repeat protein [Cucumis melo var. makuwa]TYK30795.1 F-box/LRR-repeat protein [Cucumis melo var. makuwa]